MAMTSSSQNRQILKPIITVVWLAIGASAEYIGAAIYCGLKPIPALVFASAFITFAIYLSNKHADESDAINRPEQRRYFLNNPWLLLPAAALAITSLMLAGRVNLAEGAWFLMLILIGFAYNWGLRAFRTPSLEDHRPKRLRDVYFLKNLSVSLSWGVSPFAIVWLQTPDRVDLSAAILVLTVVVSASALIDNISCDVRDRLADMHAHTKTLATMHNRVKCRRGLIIFIILAISTIIVLCTQGVLNRLEAWFGVIVLLYSFLVSAPYLYGREKPELHYVLLADSQATACGLGLMLIAMT